MNVCDLWKAKLPFSACEVAISTLGEPSSALSVRSAVRKNALRPADARNLLAVEQNRSLRARGPLRHCRSELAASFREQLSALDCEEAQPGLDAAWRGKPRHATIGGDEPMAGNQERPWILCERSADGARRCGRLAEGGGELTKAPRLAGL